jgi:hypothetical protein
MEPWDVPWVVVMVYESGMLQNRRVSTALAQPNMWTRAYLLTIQGRRRPRRTLRAFSRQRFCRIVAFFAATTEVEAAELFWFLGFFVVVGQVVGLCCADVDAGRGFAAGHDHGATPVGISLVLLRNLHLATVGDHLRGCVLAGGSGLRVEEVGQGVWSCWD